MQKFFRTIDLLVTEIARVVAILAMTGMMVLIAWAVIARRSNLFIFPGWDEVVELMFAWLVFLGTMIHWRDRSLFTVDIIQHVLPKGAKRALQVLISFLMLCLAGVILFWGAEFAFETGEVTPVLSVSKTFWYAALPVSGLGMTVYGLLHFWRALRGTEDTAIDHIEDHI